MSKSTTRQLLSKGSVHSHYKRYIDKNTFITCAASHADSFGCIGYKVNVQA